MPGVNHNFLASATFRSIYMSQGAPSRSSFVRAALAALSATLGKQDHHAIVKHRIPGADTDKLFLVYLFKCSLNLALAG